MARVLQPLLQFLPHLQKQEAIAAVSSALIGGTAAGVITGIETEDFDESMKAAALAGSDGYKWGAITGALTGGASEVIALKGSNIRRINNESGCSNSEGIKISA